MIAAYSTIISICRSDSAVAVLTKPEVGEAGELEAGFRFNTMKLVGSVKCESALCAPGFEKTGL
jgi:hypothetical protein